MKYFNGRNSSIEVTHPKRINTKTKMYFIEKEAIDGASHLMLVVFVRLSLSRKFSSIFLGKKQFM